MQAQTIRHGEIILQPVQIIVTDEFKTVENYIVGHSETGHHHLLEGDSQVLEREGRDPIVALFNDTPLVHKKDHDTHKTILVPGGNYRVLRKTEYDPFQSVMREVWD